MGGGLFTFQLNKYSVTEYENYKDDDFTGITFCDSGCCSFPALCFTNKHTICTASL